MTKRMETLVAETILQTPQVIKVKEKEYLVAPPTTATLIAASRYIVELPDIVLNGEGDITPQVLAYASKYDYLSQVAAIMILGAKGLTEKRRVSKRRFFGLIEYDVDEETVDKQAELAKELNETLSPEEMHLLLAELLKMMRTDYFFASTIFLQKVNLLGRMVNDQTVSGQ